MASAETATSHRPAASGPPPRPLNRCHCLWRRPTWLLLCSKLREQVADATHPGQDAPESTPVPAFGQRVSSAYEQADEIPVQGRLGRRQTARLQPASLQNGSSNAATSLASSCSTGSGAKTVAVTFPPSSGTRPRAPQRHAAGAGPGGYTVASNAPWRARAALALHPVIRPNPERHLRTRVVADADVPSVSTQHAETAQPAAR